MEIYIHRYTHIHIDTYIHTYTDTHIHTDIYIHTSPRKHSGFSFQGILKHSHGAPKPGLARHAPITHLSASKYESIYEWGAPATAKLLLPVSTRICSFYFKEKK